MVLFQLTRTLSFSFKVEHIVLTSNNDDYNFTVVIMSAQAHTKLSATIMALVENYGIFLLTVSA